MFGSASTAPQLETKFLASLAPPMLACAAPGKYISRIAALLARSLLFEKFSLKEIFKGCCLLFSYQGSCRSLSSDSFNSLSKLFRFVKNFFYFPSRVSLNILPLFTAICQPFFTSFFNSFFRPSPTMMYGISEWYHPQRHPFILIRRLQFYRFQEKQKLLVIFQ